MVLINLSSNGEKDPAKFTNTFSESFTIQKNSYICLISASIFEDLTNASITLVAGLTMTLRFDALNCYQVVVNANETTYKINDFVTHINGLLGGFFYLGRRFRAHLSSNNDGDIIMNFDLYRVDDNSINYLRHVFPTNTLDATQVETQETNWIAGAWDGTISAPVAAQGLAKGIITTAQNNILGLFANGAAGPQGTSEIFILDAKLTNTLAGYTQEYTQINQPNRNVICQLNGFRDNAQFSGMNTIDDDYYFTQFTIANSISTQRGTDPNTKNLIFNYSNLQIDNATNQLTDIGDFQPLEMVFGAEQLFTTLVDTSGSTDLIQTTNYNCGDVFRILLQPQTIAPYSSIPTIQRFDYNGLVAWIPNQINWTTGTGATALTYNTRTILPFAGTNLLYRTIGGLPQEQWNSAFNSTTTNRRLSSSCTGCWISKGLNDRVATDQSNSSYVDNGLNEAITDVTYGGNYSTFTKDVVLFNRVDTITPEPPTAISSKRQVIKIPAGAPPKLSLFTGTNINCVSFLFRLRDDSAVVTGTGQYAMTLLGGVQRDNTTKTPIFVVQAVPTTSGSVMDLTIYDSLGSPKNVTLQDATATRLDIQYDNWYHFIYTDDGDTNFKVEIKDLQDVNGTTYSVTSTLTNYGLPHVTTIGGSVNNNDGAFNDAVNYMFGHIADFRYYSKPYRAAATLADWDVLRTELQTGYFDGTYNRSIAAQPTESTIYDLEENKYGTILQPDPANIFSPNFLANNVVNTDLPNNFYFATDVFVPPCYKMAYADRIKTLPQRALTDSGNGLVEAEALHAEFQLPHYDAVNQRSIETYVYEPNIGPQNPYYNEPAELQDLALDDEVFNVEVTNLPHRTLNGKNKSMDKTIYQLPVETGIEKNNLKITEHSPASKVWIPLNNPMEIPLNQLDIQISKEDGTKADNLQPDTHVSIQIEQRQDIFN